MAKSILPRVNVLKHSLNPVFLTITVVAVVCFVFSYLVQYRFEWRPCNLCLVQRHVYGGMAFCGILGLIRQNKNFFRKMMFFILVIGICVALYHSLVYVEAVEAKCTIQTTPQHQMSDFENQLAHSTDCSKLPSTLFRIPVPLINLTIYIGAFALLCNRKRTIMLKFPLIKD